MSGLQSEIQSYSSFIKNYPDIKIIEGINDDSQLKVYLDDVAIDGDLSLDNYSDFDAIYCFGNLTVTGDIENYNSEGGIGLFVAGETKVNNIIAGGAVIYFNQVVVKELCVAHYNDGILEIKEFSQGVLISNDHSTGFSALGVSAVAFLDYASKQKNSYLIQEFHDLFQDEPWIELEDDDDEPFTYFNVSDFIGLLADKKLDIEKLKSEIKQYQQQVKKNEKNYLSIDTVILKEIRGIINSKVGDMRSSGYDFDELLYDLGLGRKDSVKIIHGDTVINEDFCIDQNQWQGISLLLIDGNFDVKGTIYNNHNNPAVKTLIIGNVQCENLVFSGEYLYINGALNVRECFYHYGNEDNENASELFVDRRINSNFPIIEYFTELEAYFDDETKLIFANADIRKSRPINEIQKLINPDYISFDKDRHVLIESEKLINAILSKSEIYDKEARTQLVDKSENRKAIQKAKTQKWLSAFETISNYLDKHSIEHNLYNYFCELEMKADSYIELVKKSEEIAGSFEFNINIRYEKSALKIRLGGEIISIKGEEEMRATFLIIVSDYLSDQLINKTFIGGHLSQVMLTNGNYLVNCLEGRTEEEIKNLSKEQVNVTTQFNLDKQELQQMLGELTLILA